jgi:hypothetical protein
VRANVGGGVGGVVADAAVSTVLDVAKVFAVAVLRVGEATVEAIGEQAGVGRAALAVVTDVGRGAAVGVPAFRAVSRGVRLLTTARVAKQGLASAEAAATALPAPTVYKGVEGPLGDKAKYCLRYDLY